MKFSTKILTTVAVSGVLTTTVAIILSSHRIHDAGVEDLVEKSQAILSRLESVRGYIAEQGGLNVVIDALKAKYPDGNIPQEEKLNILKQVPVFAAMKVGSENSDKEHYQFRVFSDKPRNEKNMATESEMTILKKFQQDDKLPEVVVETDKEVIVYRPVRLSEAQGCLTCHGSPSKSPWGNGKDILGIPMEDWKDGYLHGVFAIVSSKQDVIQAANESTWNIIGWGTLACLATMAGAYVFMRPLFTSLQLVVDLLSGSGDQVESASHEISESAQKLSHSSAEAAARIEQTSASTEEVTSTITRNNEYTEQAKNLATVA